jgi:hypothetical protein
LHSMSRHIFFFLFSLYLWWCIHSNLGSMFEFELRTKTSSQKEQKKKGKAQLLPQPLGLCEPMSRGLSSPPRPTHTNISFPFPGPPASPPRVCCGLAGLPQGPPDVPPRATRALRSHGPVAVALPWRVVARSPSRHDPGPRNRARPPHVCSAHARPHPPPPRMPCAVAAHHTGHWPVGPTG